MPKATVRANARTAPQSAIPDDYASSEVDELEAQADKVFTRAYSDWLKAKAEVQDQWVEDDEVMAARLDVEQEAERRLMATPAAYPDQVWEKLEAFEAILGDELRSGSRRYSVLMLALGCIKQDIVNLEICDR